MEIVSRTPARQNERNDSPVQPDEIAAFAQRIGGCRTLAEDAVLGQIATITRHADLRAGRYVEALAAARITLDRLQTVGLVRGAGGFDLTEVVNLLALGETGRGGFALPPCGVETGRRLTATLANAMTTDAPPGHSALPPRLFTIRFERTFHQPATTPARPRRLRLPLPVVDSQLRLEDVVTDVDARLLPGRIELRPPDAMGQVTLGATFRFVSDPAAPHGLEDDAAPWLADVEGAIWVTPRVRLLAKRLGRGLGIEAAILAFRDHLLDAFGCGPVHYHRIGAMPATDWVLEHRWYDCRLGRGAAGGVVPGARHSGASRGRLSALGCAGGALLGGNLAAGARLARLRFDDVGPVRRRAR